MVMLFNLILAGCGGLREKKRGAEKDLARSVDL